MSSQPKVKGGHDQLGRRIVEAVGLPFTGRFEPVDLGETAAHLIKQSQEAVQGRGKKRNVEIAMREGEEIAKALDKIRSRILKLNDKLDDPLEPLYLNLGTRSPLIQRANELSLIVDWFEKAFPREAEGIEWNAAQSEPKSLTHLIGHWFMVYFRFYFGEDAPSITYDPVNNAVRGPFIRFARVILDEAGVELSDAAIAKYPARAKKAIPETPWFFRD